MFEESTYKIILCMRMFEIQIEYRLNISYKLKVVSVSIKI